VIIDLFIPKMLNCLAALFGLEPDKVSSDTSQENICVVAIIAFLVGLVVGATFGVFSFILLETFVCILTFVEYLHFGYMSGILHAVKMSALLSTGFVSGIVAVYLVSLTTSVMQLRSISPPTIK